jgi:hypothetical protein
MSHLLLLIALAAPWFMFARNAVDVAPVWAGHPVPFDLLTHGDRQFVAFYDAGRNMTVAARTLGSAKWQFVRLPSQLKWDSHNSLTMAIDRDGQIHLAGNMHAAALVYFRTTRKLDIASFEQVPSMVGRNETRCTYPRWIRSPAGELIFTYRDGGSGAGDQIYNIYDEKARAWKRLIDTPLIDGQGLMNAYPHGPVLGPDGYYHLVWTWRDTPDCSTNHDLSYARSRDLVSWENSAGKPYPLPIRFDAVEVVDAVPVHGGMINGNTKIGFDSKHRVVITYHKFDAKGFTQIMAARRDAEGWRIRTVSDWAYRWDFQGRGSIEFEVTHGAVRPAGGGKLRLDYRHVKYGSGAWLLDEETHAVAGKAAAEQPLPAGMDKVESGFPGMRVNLAADTGKPPKGVRYTLRWETLGRNRDRPREGPAPPPSMLRVIESRPDR